MLSAVTSTEANRWIGMDFENYRVALGVLALAAAWPVWTAGVWLVAKRLVAPGGQRPGYGQVARVLAFAQAPGVFGPALLLPPQSARPHVFSQRGWAHGEPAPLALVDILVEAGWSLLVVWVFLGTLLALREGLRLSGGQALSALITVGAGVAVLLGHWL